ncbi:sensor histidine kinase [Candidatus Leptofilum sp.]|uniref:sensor histidine kinase n=1 Tax=Candidatus Leptofilum sp. TaxID=3241576 RepID=UPI003B58E289
MSWKIFWPTIHDLHGKEEVEQLILLLDRILKIAFILTVIGSLASIFIVPLSAFELLIMGAALLLFMIALTRFLLRQKRLLQASIIFLLSLWVIFILLTIFNGGVSSAAPTTFIFGVLVAGLLLGERAAKSFAGLSVLTTAVLYVLEVSQRLPSPPLPLTPTTGLAGFIILLFATTGVYSLTIRKLQQTINALSASEAESKKAEHALRENMARYQALFEHANDAIWVYDLDDKVMTANSRACELSGYTLEEMLGKTPEFFTVPEEFDEVYNRYQEVVVQGGSPPIYERTLICKNGDKRICEVRASRVEDEAGNPICFQGMIRDVTERKQAEAQIQASLQEKEILLKEIHHRVKNNLQVISSLLDLQSAYIEDDAVQEMFQESRSRVRSMALVHEQLYQSIDLARIDFADYVQNLASYLLRVYGQMASGVTLDVDVDNTPLSVETAVPLGLIINELVSNALKHAFPNGRSGQIRTHLRAEDDYLYLTVQDDGIGFPDDVDFRQSPSLGLTIIMTLVNQLQGQIELSTQDGTRFELVFSHESAQNGHDLNDAVSGESVNY